MGQKPGTNEEIQETVCTRFKAEFPIFDKTRMKILNDITAKEDIVLKLDDSSPILKQVKRARFDKDEVYFPEDVEGELASAAVVVKVENRSRILIDLRQLASAESANPQGERSIRQGKQVIQYSAGKERYVLLATSKTIKQSKDAVRHLRHLNVMSKSGPQLPI
ncbi:hypothetical protein CTI12_AA364650 [Artemisia annua]|uniref:Uncharacterized protein n=1 Tax=Artemisia annua TaxID=35608 RepID=A0A2U1MMA6_ARTAN|nr:hypothetical protein CTI12_AA364650 [Artemisia annua]